MDFTQEQINQLRQEINSVGRQITILSGPEFAESVPEIANAIRALTNYKNHAAGIVAQWDAEHGTAQPAMPAVRPGILNLAGIFGGAAAPAAQVAPAAVPAQAAAGIDINALRANPLFQALVAAMAPQAQG